MSEIAALDILIRDGYSAVNIKSIAKELKRSTQPIAWQFSICPPNLFRFVYMGESKNYCRDGFNSILTDKGNAVLIDKLYQYLDISKEQVHSIVKDFGSDLLSLTGANLNIQDIISNITEV